MLPELPGDCIPIRRTNPRPSYGLVNRIINILYAAFHQEDINHVTGDVNYITFLLRRKRTLLTVLDFGHIPRPRWRQWLFTLLWFKIPVKRAALIAVISEFTRKEVLRVTGCDPARIRVIPCCISPVFQPVARDFRESCPTILQIGTNRNKNVERVAAALAGFDCELHIVGILSESQLAALERAGVSYRNSVALSERDLVSAYEDSDLVVFASTYEGFGLPILEAQAIGRPVVTSALAPMNDVAGDAACLVDPFNVDSIRAGISRVCSDPVWRAQLVAGGFSNVKRFQPRQIAMMYAAIYRELLVARAPRLNNEAASTIPPA
jgi:glycosyltransferase involved in cell wall biosynthesis